MQKFYVISSLFLLCSASSFAIDQVTLTTGEVLEGKVLADVPNRHVDVQLINGQKRRLAKSEVANVERDVPSNKDRDMAGVDKRIFFGPLLGGIVPTGGGSLELMWGGKIGFNSGMMGGAHFAPGLSFRHYQSTVAAIQSSTNLLNAQFLFRRIGSSGFYMGPQVGLGLTSTSNALTNVSLGSSNAFVAGAALGYDAHFSDSFSIGPDIVFDHSFASGGGNTISFGLAALFHFD